jgi:hypothetical protein
MSKKKLGADKVASAKLKLAINTPAAESRKNSSSCSKKRQRLAQPISTTSDAAQGKDDVNCLYCNELYSMPRSREVWVMCEECNKWAHVECAGLNKRQKRFKCDFCVV